MHGAGDYGARPHSSVNRPQIVMQQAGALPASPQATRQVHIPGAGPPVNRAAPSEGSLTCGHQTPVGHRGRSW